MQIPSWQKPTWRQAITDTNRASHTVRFWMAEALTVAVAALVVVPFYPDGASAFEQAAMSSGAVAAATIALIILIFLANWVAFSPRGQTADARREIDRLQDCEDWRILINDIAAFINEGNSAMEAYGRPAFLDSSKGLDFMNRWLPNVAKRLPEEYRPDFASQGRGIFKSDAVWVELLDVRLTRLREIAADIRNRHL